MVMISYKGIRDQLSVIDDHRITEALNRIDLVIKDVINKLEESEGSGRTVITITSSHVPTEPDEFILVDATSAAVTVRLPSAFGVRGQTHTVKRISGGVNSVFVDTHQSSESIDGSTSISLASQWSWITIVSNGANWFKVASG